MGGKIKHREYNPIASHQTELSFDYLSHAEKLESVSISFERIILPQLDPIFEFVKNHKTLKSVSIGLGHSSQHTLNWIHTIVMFHKLVDAVDANPSVVELNVFLRISYRSSKEFDLLLEGIAELSERLKGRNMMLNGIRVEDLGGLNDKKNANGFKLHTNRILIIGDRKEAL